MQHSSLFKSIDPMIHFKMILASEFWQGFLYAVLGAVTAFLLPIAHFLGLVLALVFCDLFTGTRAAKARKEKIHSKGLRRTVEKLTLYFICILLSEGFRLVFMPAAPVTYMAAFAIALTEFKSNIENVETVTGVKVWQVLSSSINRFRNK